MKKQAVILFIDRGPFGFIGGTDSYMFPKVLAQIGFSVKVLSFIDSWGETITVDNTHDYERLTVTNINENSFLKRIKIIRKALSDFKPDIVHVFPHQRYYLLPWFCKSLTGTETTKWLIDIRYPPVYLRKLPLFKRAFNQLFDPLKQMGFDVITTPDKSSAYNWFKSIYRPVYKTPFGVDCDSIKKRKWPVNIEAEKTVKFVYVGSISKLRKLDTLVEGIEYTEKKIKKHKRKRKFLVDFFGSGDGVDDLLNLIEQKGLSSIVTYRGVIPQKELFDQLCNYDVGIGYVPYEQYMGSPALKVIEYMAANLIVAASDTEGIKGQINNGKNGLLFKNAPMDISDLFVDIIRNDVNMDMISNGLKTAKKRSWENRIKQFLIPVYQKLLP